MESSGLFYCPVCGLRAAVWQSDFDAEDVGFDAPGIVKYFTCSNCGAEIEAFSRFSEEEISNVSENGDSAESE